MRKVVLFTAASLDGFIAGPAGEIEWLFTDRDYGFSPFFASADTTLSGYNTYKLAASFPTFPYPGTTNYVFSRKHQKRDNNPVEFIASDPAEFVSTLKQQSGRTIWLVGGGMLNTALLNSRLIDEMILSVHPIVLGRGIPLFGGNPRNHTLSLVGTESFTSGLVQLTYIVEN
jgi:dihydrofolate reductase